ncbi:O-antigen ligase family protein [Selenomonas ruminis]|uniref:O-antigen ligase family protein n=1 Tax=Selenomonas ruminis TaxID=2593411 RepID=A0A5D6WBV7_9FIRM|nr:O-antigen ligase family protein [Selenomonas sp. mPRGC5]TYZ24505.1 O-antigen ligase family protein [Selenomonas sp. mPRGC5]
MMFKKIEINMINLYAFLIPCVTATRDAYGFSIGRIFLLTIAFIAIIDAMFSKKIKNNQYLLVLLFLYPLWMTCSLLWTPSNCVNQGIIRTGFTIAICVFFFLISCRDISEIELKKIKNKIIIGGVISSLLLIALGGDYYGDEEEVRYSLTPQTDPNYYSMYLLMPVALVFKAITTSTGKNKAIAVLSMIIMLYAIFLCGSRGALLSIFIMLVIELVRNRRFCIIMMLLFCIYMAFDSVGEIYPRFEINTLASGAGRSLIWTVITQMIKDNIICGVGVSGIKGVYDEYAIQAGVGFLAGHGRDPHNAYMEIFAELGIVGFVLYTMIILVSLYNNYKYKKNNFDMSIGIVGTLIAAFFLSSVLEEAIWFYLVLLTMRIKNDETN